MASVPVYAIQSHEELWVSAELAGIVNIIDVQTLELIGDIPFLPTGFRKEQVTPVDVLISFPNPSDTKLLQRFALVRKTHAVVNQMDEVGVCRCIP